MPEVGIPYIFTGPDGARAVLNDITDPDFVGYLDPEQGITGLLDSADVRESNTSRTERHGSFQGDNFFSRRTGTVNGFLYPNVSDMSVVNQYESKLKRATRGMKGLAPCTMVWTPTGGVQRIMWLWRQGRVTINGRRPKKFQVALASAEAFVYSAAIQSATITPSGLITSGGFSNPMTNPLQDQYGTQALQTITNSGDAETWPVFYINGPITNPELLNNTTGLSWVLTYTLGVGEQMVVDSNKRTVKLGGTANRYSSYAANLPYNKWWSLVPGANDIHLLSTDVGTGASVQIQWRHAWE